MQSQFAANTVAVTSLNEAVLCAPVSKNGGDPGALTDHTFLLCFRTTEQNDFGTLNVFLNNQFGPSTTQFTSQPFITQYDELCVPSTLPSRDPGLLRRPRILLRRGERWHPATALPVRAGAS